jgi:hypothetical protein
MLGAGLVSFKDALDMPGFSAFLPIILVGFLAALLVGYLAIHWLISFLGKRSLYVFAIYCVVLGSLVLILGLVNKDGKAQSNFQTPTPTVAVLTPESSTQIPAFTINQEENPLTIAYTSSLSWLVPVMNVCTDAIPGLTAITNEKSFATLEGGTEKVVFQWGAPSIPVSAAFTIGNEELAIFANNNNPLTSLSVSLINAIYNGQLQTWGDVFDQCPDCFTSSPIDTFQTQTISLLSYSSLEEPQSIFLNFFMNGMIDLTSPGILVPDSASMITEIEKDPAAIGFAGAHFLTGQVKRIAVADGEPPAGLVSPILAVMQNEHSPTISRWLVCIQKILTPNP